MKRILISSLLLLPALTFGASFDCSKASTRVEKVICTDKKLSSLDDALSDVYQADLRWSNSVNISEEDETPIERANRHQAESQADAAEKAWLANRNACRDRVCIERLYESRLAETSCEGDKTGSGNGASQCYYYSLLVSERELSLVEEQYRHKITTNSDNPDYVLSSFEDEQKTWRSYRSAQCRLHGALEGGSDPWKNAWAGLCELNATTERIQRLQKVIDDK